MAKAKRSPTKHFSQEILLELLRYEPETGKLFWRERSVDWFLDGQRTGQGICDRWNNRYAGKEAFTSKTKSGYAQGSVCDVPCYAHRIIWTMVHGIVDGEIDHINGVKDDNRLANLRVVTISENMRNRAASRSHNTSGVLGVSWHAKYEKWRATAFIDGKHKHLGYFDNIDDAAAARKAADEQNGYHPNHGRKPIP